MNRTAFKILCVAAGADAGGLRRAEAAAEDGGILPGQQCRALSGDAEGADGKACSPERPDIKLVVSDAQQDNSKQIAQIETFIRQKPSVLIVAPNERAALTAVMGRRCRRVFR